MIQSHSLNLAENKKGDGFVAEPFTIINQFGNILYDEDSIKASLDDYLLIQSLRNSKSTIHIANMLNEKPKMSTYHRYLIVHSLLSVYKIDLGRWISSTKKKKKDDDVIKIAIHFECSMKVADKYIDELGDDKTKEILELYKFAKIGKNSRLVKK